MALDLPVRQQAWVIQTIPSAEISVNKKKAILHIDRRRRWEKRIVRSK
jgi:hypothetical protein